MIYLLASGARFQFGAHGDVFYISRGTNCHSISNRSG
jgi:hypothetical protein